MKRIANKVGITGKVCSGKSECARYLESLGYRRVCADTIGKAITLSMKDELVSAFGDEVSDKGKLSLDKLRSFVFSSQEIWEEFNSIVHPPLLSRLREELDRGGKVVVDAALIPYWGIEDWFDLVIGVFAPLDVRLERWLRRGKERELFFMIDTLQVPPSEHKVCRVENSGGLEDLYKSILYCIGLTD